jgi:hypothetical protein
MASETKTSEIPNQVTGVRKARGSHPLTRHLYELREDGLLQVTAGQIQGLFTRTGAWVSGDLKSADPHFCMWMSQKGKAQAALRNPLIGR